MLTNLTKKYFGSQKVLVLFGAPGAGKGTYAKLIKKDMGYNHISTGDEIRKILKGNVPDSFDKSLVSKIREIVNAGGLVGDDIVINILKEKLKEPESQKGVILDGIPRTLNQLKLQDQEKIPTDLVINVWLQQSVLLEKLSARRVCATCGQSFNICSIDRDGYKMSPLNPPEGGKCERGVCKIETRADDTMEVISNRMKEYDAKTAPILDEYNKRGIVIDFEAKKGVQDYPRLKEMLSKKL